MSGRSPTTDLSGTARPSLLSSPLQGGGREGGPARTCGRGLRGWRAAVCAVGLPLAGGAAAPLSGVAGCGGGSTPLPTSPLPGGRRETAAARVLPGDSDVGEVSSALILRLLPPFRGEVGRGAPRRGRSRAFPVALLPSFRGEGRSWRHGAPLSGVAVCGGGSTPLPTSPLKGGRREGRASGRLLPGDDDVGAVSSALTPWLLPPFRGEVGRGAPRRGRSRAFPVAFLPSFRGEGRSWRRGAPLSGVAVCGGGSTPLPTSPLKGGRREGRASGRLLPGDDDVGAVSSALTPWLLPPFRGEVGRGAPRRGRSRAFPVALLPSFRGEGRSWRRGAPLSGVAVGGRGIDPPPDLPPSRGEGRSGGGVRPARRQRCRRGILRPDSLTPPPFRGEVGRGAPRRGRSRAFPVALLPSFRGEGRSWRRGAPLSGVAVCGGGSTPLPTSPLPGGRRETAAATLARRPAPRLSDSSPLQGGGREGGARPVENRAVPHAHATSRGRMARKAAALSRAAISRS